MLEQMSISPRSVSHVWALPWLGLVPRPAPPELPYSPVVSYCHDCNGNFPRFRSTSISAASKPEVANLTKFLELKKVDLKLSGFLTLLLLDSNSE